MIIPPIGENPDGLHLHYSVVKHDGTPASPDARYLVLRIDNHSSDLPHVRACRKAARTYVEEVRKNKDAEHMLQTANELEQYLDFLDGKEQ